MARDEFTHEERWEALELLREEYPDFRDFMTDVWHAIVPGGPDPTDMQWDMGHFLQCGGHDLMIQAQRGEAKTTTTCAFVVWSWIWDPTLRVLVYSAGGKMAKKITTGILQIVYSMDELACLRPSTSRKNGGMRQRESTESFDIHYALKGMDKQESLSCMGITSSSQGNRADLLIADDIESSKNARTEVTRDQLAHLMKDFASIVGEGRIVYLGTPQSCDSVYNALTAQGFVVRIWTGRFPTEKQRASYGDMLAPFIADALDADPSLGTGGGVRGDQGQPTDPIMKSEELLQGIELKQGTAYFQLQHMLNTELADAARFPLKLAHVLFASFDNQKGPIELVWGHRPENRIPIPRVINVRDAIYRPADISQEYEKYQTTIMAVDPAGGGENADETGYAVVSYLYGYLFVHEIGGFPGGVTEEEMMPLALKAKEYGVQEVLCEKNMGAGSYTYLLTSVLKTAGYPCHVEEVWSTGQKEARIIDTLEPVIGSHRLVINEACVEYDGESIKKYEMVRRASYSWLWQFARLSRERNALHHDDRIDALALAVARLVDLCSTSNDEHLALKRLREERERLENPTQLPHYVVHGYDPSHGPNGAFKRAGPGGGLGSRVNSLQRRRR